MDDEALNLHALGPRKAYHALHYTETIQYSSHEPL